MLQRDADKQISDTSGLVTASVLNTKTIALIRKKSKQIMTQENH